MYFARRRSPIDTGPDGQASGPRHGTDRARINFHEGQPTMIEPEDPRAQRGVASRAFLLLFAMATGCAPETGTVSATPKGDDGVAASNPKASPRVPRGPEAAKSLQESVPKKK
jgi:hypothetical protein